MVNSKTKPGKTVKRPKESYTPILTVEEIKSGEKVIKKIENLAKVKDVSTFVQSGEIYFVRDSKIGVVRCYADVLG